MLDTYTFGDLRAAVHAGALSGFLHRAPEQTDERAVRAYLLGLDPALLVTGAVPVGVGDDGAVSGLGFFDNPAGRIRALRFNVCGVPLLHAGVEEVCDAIAHWIARLRRDLAARSPDAFVDAPIPEPKEWRAWPSAHTAWVKESHPDAVWAYFYALTSFVNVVMCLNAGRPLVRGDLGQVFAYASSRRVEGDAAIWLDELMALAIERSTPVEEARDA